MAKDNKSKEVESPKEAAAPATPKLSSHLKLELQENEFVQGEYKNKGDTVRLTRADAEARMKAAPKTFKIVGE